MGGVIIYGRKPPTYFNGTLGWFLIHIALARFPMTPPPLDPPLVDVVIVVVMAVSAIAVVTLLTCVRATLKRQGHMQI